MADIFDEVSEDLRKDQYKQIWFKYKKFIISLVLIFVFSVVTFKLIESYLILMINILNEVQI